MVLNQQRNLKTMLHSLILKEKKILALIAVYGVISAILNLALPLSVQLLVSSIIYTALISPVIIVSIVLVFVLSFSAVLSVLQRFLIEIYERHSFVNLSSEILLKTIYSDHDSFRAHNTSDLSGRYFEIFNIQKNISELIVEGLLVVVSIIISTILSSFYHPYFFILNLILIIVIWLSWTLFSRFAIARAIHQSEAKFAIFAWIDDVFRMNVFFKSGQNKNYAVAKGLDLTQKYIHARKKYWSMSCAQLIILTILYVVITIALLSIGSILVIRGQLSLGQLIAAEILYTLSLYGVSKLSLYYDKYYKLLASVDEFSHLFLLQDEQSSSNEILPNSRLNTYEGQTILKFNHVVYVDEFKMEHVFNMAFTTNWSYLILSTQQNDSDTLIKLLLNMVPADHGHVEFNGMHTADLDPHFLRDQIYLVQNANMFGCTIREFLFFNLTPAMANMVNDVINVVGMSASINMLPQRWDTKLIGDGYPLQERQIILLKIAKAILVNPKVIVITEIFDKIDLGLRGNIIDYIEKNMQTTLICFSNNNSSHDLYQDCIALRS